MHGRSGRRTPGPAGGTGWPQALWRHGGRPDDPAGHRVGHRHRSGSPSSGPTEARRSASTRVAGPMPSCWPRPSKRSAPSPGAPSPTWTGSPWTSAPGCSPGCGWGWPRPRPWPRPWVSGSSGSAASTSWLRPPPSGSGPGGPGPGGVGGRCPPGRGVRRVVPVRPGTRRPVRTTGRSIPGRSATTGSSRSVPETLVAWVDDLVGGGRPDHSGGRRCGPLPPAPVGRPLARPRVGRGAVGAAAAGAGPSGPPSAGRRGPPVGGRGAPARLPPPGRCPDQLGAAAPSGGGAGSRSGGDGAPP